MQRAILMGLVLPLWLPFAVPAEAQAPAAAEEGLAVVSRIAEVTVYADRARVTRTGAVELGAGATRFAFAKLPGWIDEGSVRVSVTPASAAELTDVEVRRTYLARPDDQEMRKAEALAQDLADQLAALDDEQAALEAQTRQVDAVRAFALDKMPKDAAVRQVKVEEYGDVVKFVGTALGEIAKGKRELEKKRRGLKPELEARGKALDELRQRAQLEQRTVIVTLLPAAGVRQATLNLTYLLPGATWAPLHELRTGGAADKVALSSFGVVTQTTGENWEGVALTLSTQRAEDTIRIPELEKLLVGARLPARGADTFSVANGKFTGQIKLWNTVQNPKEQQAEFAQNWDAQQVAQAGNAMTFERLQEQRGTTAHFAATGTQTVRTDGRPVRVPIGAAQLTAKFKLVAVPEVSLNVVRTADLLNVGDRPLLPGQVLLYVDGAFLGTTALDFVAPGEAFAAFVGVADCVKLSRVLDRKHSGLTWTGRRKRLQVAYVVTTANLSDKPLTLALTDRVPVSETDDVRVLNVKVQPEAKPDEKGLLRWDVPLAAGEQKTFRLEYVLDYAANPSQSVAPASVDLSVAPAAAAPDTSRQIREQIEVLEKTL